MTRPGRLITFEGGEGAGKSTQSRLLRDWLVERGETVLLTFEPGDTPVGQELRRIVLDPATGDLSDRTEALLYAADKAEHVDHVVLPALARGEVVVTDRVEHQFAPGGTSTSRKAVGAQTASAGLQLGSFAARLDSAQSPLLGPLLGDEEMRVRGPAPRSYVERGSPERPSDRRHGPANARA